MTEKIKRKIPNMQYLRNQGLTLKAIARICEVSPRSVKEHTTPKETPQKPKKLCETCKYRTRFDGEWGCYYIVLVGKRRNCDPQNCKKYEQGKAIADDIGKESKWI